MSKLDKNGLEWVVFGFSSLLVLGTLAFLVRDASKARTPPDVIVELGESVSGAAGHRVPLEIINRGGETAEDVHVEVMMESGAGEKETASVAIEFLPRGSSRKAWVMFKEDPRAAKKIEGRAVGYEVP